MFMMTMTAFHACIHCISTRRVTRKRIVGGHDEDDGHDNDDHSCHVF